MGPNARPAFSVETKTALSRFFDPKAPESAGMSSVSEIERVVLDYVTIAGKTRGAEITSVFANAGALKLLSDRARAPFTIESEIVTAVLGREKLSPLLVLSLEATKSYAFEPTAVMDAGARLLLEGQEGILPVLGAGDEITESVRLGSAGDAAARDGRIPVLEPEVERLGGAIFRAMDEIGSYPAWYAELEKAASAPEGGLPPRSAELASRLSAALGDNRLNKLAGLIAEVTMQMEVAPGDAARLMKARDGFVAEAEGILKDIDSWKSLITARDLAFRQVFFPFNQAGVAYQASLRNDGFVPKASPLPFEAVGARPVRAPLPALTVFVTGDPEAAVSQLSALFGRKDLPEFTGWENLTAIRVPGDSNRLIVRGEKDGYAFTLPLEIVSRPAK